MSMSDLSLADVIGTDAMEQQLRERALDELVELLMDGRCYPKHGRSYSRIDLDTILQEADTSEISSIVRDCLFASSSAECSVDLREGIEALVKRSMRDTSWHDRMADQVEEDEHELRQG